MLAGGAVRAVSEIQYGNLLVLIDVADGVDGELLEVPVPGVLGILDAGMIDARCLDKYAARGGVRSEGQRVRADDTQLPGFFIVESVVQGEESLLFVVAEPRDLFRHGSAQLAFGPWDP